MPASGLPRRFRRRHRAAAFWLGFSLLTLLPVSVNGMGVRASDWDLGVTLQQQIMPRVSVGFAYFRRIFGGFLGGLLFHRDAAFVEAWSADAPRFGAPIAPGDLSSWDISVGPDGAGLPPGRGTPAHLTFTRP